MLFGIRMFGCNNIYSENNSQVFSEGSQDITEDGEMMRGSP